MSCFWVGLISALKLGVQPASLIQTLKDRNTETKRVTWNGATLKNRMFAENKAWIDALDAKTVNNGYDCSTCDPVLLLVSELFDVSIYHNYNGTNITYTNKDHPGNVIHVRSDRGHFWAGR